MFPNKGIPYVGVWTALMSFSIAVYVLEVGGSNKSIASQAEGGLTRMSAPLFTGGFEPKAFFIEDANSTRFTVEGLSSSPQAKSVYEEILHFRSVRPNVQGKEVTREATREAKMKRGGMKERFEKDFRAMRVFCCC